MIVIIIATDVMDPSHVAFPQFRYDAFVPSLS